MPRPIQQYLKGADKLLEELLGTFFDVEDLREILKRKFGDWTAEEQQEVLEAAIYLANARYRESEQALRERGEFPFSYAAYADAENCIEAFLGRGPAQTPEGRRENMLFMLRYPNKWQRKKLQAALKRTRPGARVRLGQHA
jgi:hypothetical protein